MRNSLTTILRQLNVDYKTRRYGEESHLLRNVGSYKRHLSFSER
jgi:hypothetical protein